MNVIDNGERPYILDDIVFQPDLGSLAKRLRLRDGSQQLAEFAGLLKTVAAIARPKAMYKLAYVDDRSDESVTVDGVRLHSRVLRVNLAVAHRLFVYVATCGAELQTWSDGLDDMLYRYWADAIKEAALEVATQALNAHLHECYALGRTATMAPGSLADWPIRQQRPLFQILGDAEAAIGVQLTESFLMIPNKTTSGIRFPTEERFESCQLCPRGECPGRRAAYEPDLFERKYQQPQQA
jgi:hypothetical protein